MGRPGASKLAVALLLTIIALAIAITLYLTPRGTLVTTFTPGGTVTITETPTITLTSSVPTTPAITLTETITITETPNITPTSSVPSSTATESPSITVPGTTPPPTETYTGAPPTTLTYTAPTTTSAPETSSTTPPYTSTTTPARIISARLITPSRIWFSVERASKVLEYDSSTGRVTPVYGDYPTYVSSFTPHPAVREKLYYVNANENKVYLALRTTTGWNKQVAFEFETYIRCYRFGPGLSSDPTGFMRAYFSTARGAGGDGTIYVIVNNTARPFMTIRIRDIGGFWAGNFEFAPDGTLYVSNGNVQPSSIFEYRGGRFVEIARFGFPVMGMDYVRNVRLALMETPGGEVTVTRGLLFANHKDSIYLHDLDTGTTYRVFSDPSYGSSWITDVAVAP